jgi:hypothetical protein
VAAPEEEGLDVFLHAGDGVVALADAPALRRFVGNERLPFRVARSVDEVADATITNVAAIRERLELLPRLERALLGAPPLRVLDPLVRGVDIQHPPHDHGHSSTRQRHILRAKLRGRLRQPRVDSILKWHRPSSNRSGGSSRAFAVG